MLSSGGGGASINVDVVGLPNVLKKDIQEMATLDSAEEETAEQKEMVLKENVSINKKKLLAKLKQSVESKDNYLKKIKVIKGMKSADNNKISEAQKTGTETGTGSGQGEGNGESTGPTVNPYFVNIKDLVRTYWQIPTWLKSEGLNTQITIKIGDDGQLTHIQITKTSGNSDFDKLAYQAVKNSSPFTPPPLAVKDIVENGVILSFP